MSTVFLVQNEYYAVLVSRAQAHDNARMATELLGSELRSVMADGVVIAENKQLVVRSPMVLGVVCATRGRNTAYVHMEGGVWGIDTLEMSGFARREAPLNWTYYPSQWYDIRGVAFPRLAAVACERNGADTTGISQEFLMLTRLRRFIGTPPAVGNVLMLYRELEYRFETSTMDPTALALYRGIYGSAPTEYVTGMDSTAQFQYRTGGSSYTSSVNPSGVGTIDAIRIVVEARKAVRAGGAEDVAYGWAVNVPLRNAR